MPAPATNDFARRLDEHQRTASALMAEIRVAANYLRDHTDGFGRRDYSLTRLERYVIGVGPDGRGLLHKNSLLRLNDPEWSPKPETMRLLQRIIIRAAHVRAGKPFPNEDTLKRGRKPGHTNGAAAPPAKAKPVKKRAGRSR